MGKETCKLHTHKHAHTHAHTHTHTQGTLCDDSGNRLDAVYVRPDAVSYSLPSNFVVIVFTLCYVLSS